MTAVRTRNRLRPPAFEYRGSTDKQLFCEKVDLASLADRYGTPLYVYSAQMMQKRLQAFARAFDNIPHTICYSVKANSTLGILRLVAAEGAGFDIVSAGELQRVLRADRNAAKRTVFSGVGKTGSELELALRSNIMLFNVESESELHLLSATAKRLNKRASIAIRVNPDVSAKTHPYISTGLRQHKFGVPITEAETLYANAASEKHLSVIGVSVHIGSQITDLKSFQEAIQRVAELVRLLRRRGHDIKVIDAGGGLGISYEGPQADFEKQIAAYARAVTKPLQGMKLHLLLEPGRSVIGPAGALLTRVIYRKMNGKKRFLIVDAAMNDLIRPSLYSAFHEIVPTTLSSSDKREETTDVVGPVCETGDFFARDRRLPIVKESDLLAILDTGAYGSVLGSNYNTRGKAPEVLVDGTKHKLIRRRETVDDQLRIEK